jgi:hypothetical protein
VSLSSFSRYVINQKYTYALLIFIFFSLLQVPETLSDDILEKLHAPPKPDIPVITVDALTEADAFLFGKVL